MKIISTFKDFYDFNAIYDTDDSIQYRRQPSYIDKNSFDDFVSRIPIRRAQNLLKKYKRWSETYSRPMEGNGYYMAFEYHVIGIFPYVYLIPVVIIYKMGLGRNITSNPDTPIEFFYKDLGLPFNSQALRDIGNKYGMDFIQYKGKGPNKKPLHRVILRKFTDIESSFFYLRDYISPDDIVIESVENLKSPDFRELFHMIESPIFYMSSWSSPKHEQEGGFIKPLESGWNFVLDPDLSEINYISFDPFTGKGIYERIEEFITEHSNIEIPEPSNEVKIEAAGFDKVTSFRKPKEEKKNKSTKNDKSNSKRNEKVRRK